VICPPRLDGGVPWPGETIGGKYLVDGLCGKRGSALVLRAASLPSGGHVAIEVLEPERSSHTILVEQFLREGEAAMRIRSEHAVRVLDEGRLANGAPYLVLEYVEAPTLEQIASQRGRLPVPTVIDWLLQALEAIAQAHSYGVVHGELTLSKMFVVRRPAGTPCVKVDFGQRKMTWASASGASPAAQRDVDVGPDLRALGAALDRLLFQAPIGSAERGTSVPLSLEVVVRRCLEMRPDRRFASVAELARSLAPFGSPAARVSCERIECLLEDRAAELTRRKPRLVLDWPVLELERESSPDEPTDRKRPYATPASGRVVFVALAMLAALGAAAFGVMYKSVPRGEPPRSIGVTEMQPSTPSTDTAPPRPRSEP
jgi:Protein kinase domain